MTPSQIRTIRKRLGLSVNEMAEALGFSGKHRANSVYRLETGERKPGGATLKLLEQLSVKKAKSP